MLTVRRVLPLVFASLLVSAQDSFPPKIISPELSNRRQPPNRIRGLAPVQTLIGRALTVEEQAEMKRGYRVASPSSLLGAGAWEGRTWRLTVEVPGALGLRVHVSRADLGSGNLWIYEAGDSSSPAFGPYTGRGLWKDGDFWTELVFADRLTIEYEAPPNRPSRELPFHVEDLFVLTEPLAGQPDSGRQVYGHWCLLDVNCYTLRANEQEAARTGVYLLSANGGSCSANWINTRYERTLLLSAGHCFQSAEEARSLLMISMWRSPACDRQPADPRTFPQAVGATMLRWNVNRTPQGGIIPDRPDYALLLPLAVIPGVVSAGWDPRDFPLGSFHYSISHAASSPQVYSAGRVDSIQTFFNQITFTFGRSTPGSSGAAFFDSTAGRAMITGVTSFGPLGGGQDPCSFVPLMQAGITKFSAIYNETRAFFEDPNSLPVVQQTSGRVWIEPNPVTRCIGGIGFGSFSWDIANGEAQIRINSPTGPPVTNWIAGRGQTDQVSWLRNGMVAYLVDRQGNVLHSATVSLSCGGAVSGSTISIEPGMLDTCVTPNPFGSIRWSTDSIRDVQIRVGGPSGPPVTSWMRSGSGQTEPVPWLQNRMQVFLMDSANRILAMSTVRRGCGSFPVLPPSSIAVEPQAITSCTTHPDGSVRGIGRVVWRTEPWASPHRIQINAVNPAYLTWFSQVPANASGLVNWIADGMQFLLVTTEGHVLAYTTATVPCQVGRQPEATP